MEPRLVAVWPMCCPEICGPATVTTAASTMLQEQRTRSARLRYQRITGTTLQNHPARGIRWPELLGCLHAGGMSAWHQPGHNVKKLFVLLDASCELDRISHTANTLIARTWSSRYPYYSLIDGTFSTAYSCGRYNGASNRVIRASCQSTCSPLEHSL
ncbi:hypothetical protein BD779DRAFT_881096 [Infundibulicybe gibba]|nr:hypothetical protein BD779DRAFT_881096 [Infundibulicybe gibba]